MATVTVTLTKGLYAQDKNAVTLALFFVII
jgi:hypothetical protein